MRESIHRAAVMAQVVVLTAVLAACGGGGEVSDDTAVVEARTSQSRGGPVSDGAEPSIAAGEISPARDRALLAQGDLGRAPTVAGSTFSSAKLMRTVYRVRGATATAQMSLSTSCVNLNVQVSGSEKMTRDGGGVTPAVGVYVAVSGFDACRGSLIDGSMEVSGASFSGTVSDATARASLPVNLYEMVEVDGVWIRVEKGYAILDLQLLWTGSGASYLSRTFETNSSPTGVVRNRYWGRWQEAGITAAVSYDGEDMILMDAVGTTGVFVTGTIEIIRY